MRLLITSTDIVAKFDGVPCRVWHGREEDTGQECFVLVHRVAVPLTPETTIEQFARELIAQSTPLDVET